MRSDRWMQCEARSQPNQGESEGVYNHTRPSLSPPIWQEIVRNAPPQVIFFTKIKTITIFYKSTYPYSQSERFTFAARRKASHCGAMLHAGKNSRRFTLICDTQINTPPLPFSRKAKYFCSRWSQKNFYVRQDRIIYRTTGGTYSNPCGVIR